MFEEIAGSLNEAAVAGSADGCEVGDVAAAAILPLVSPQRDSSDTQALGGCGVAEGGDIGTGGRERKACSVAAGGRSRQLGRLSETVGPDNRSFKLPKGRRPSLVVDGRRLKTESTTLEHGLERDALITGSSFFSESKS